MLKKIRMYLYLFLFLLIVNKHYSFYEMYGDIPFIYDVVFEGEVILESRYLNYTNKQVRFTFDYAVTTRSDLASKKEQIITMWRFSPLKTHNLPIIFDTLWYKFLKLTFDDLAYSVKLPTDQFLVIDRFGRNHPMGYFLEFLFPIVDFKNSHYIQKYNFELPGEYRKTRYVSINIEGWNFFTYVKPSTAPPLPILETNTQFINHIYSNYAEQKKNSQSTIFWMQTFTVSFANIFGQSFGSSDLVAMYFLDPSNKVLKRYIAIGELDIELPYIQDNMSVPITVKLNGEFQVKLANNIP